MDLRDFFRHTQTVEWPSLKARFLFQSLEKGTPIAGKKTTWHALSRGDSPWHSVTLFREEMRQAQPYRSRSSVFRARFLRARIYSCVRQRRVGVLLRNYRHCHAQLDLFCLFGGKVLSFARRLTARLAGKERQKHVKTMGKGEMDGSGGWIETKTSASLAPGDFPWQKLLIR